MAPRKVRLVIDTIRGKSALVAETQLSFLKKGAAEPVLKLLRSAMANATHNFQMQKEDLVVKTITADGGPTIKRSRPRAFGRSAPIRKRTTHIMIVLASKKDVMSEKKQVNVKPAVVASPAEAPQKKKTVTRKKVSAPKTNV